MSINLVVMKKYVGIACFVVIALGGCKKDNSGSSTPAATSNFNPGKGWKLVQTVTDDQNINGANIGVLGFVGLDFRGTNNNLRIFYWQGWQSQQDFLYLDTRIDEFNPAGQRVRRTDLPFINELQNQNKNPHKMLLLRNGIPSYLILDAPSGGWGNKWQIYEQDAMKAETIAQYGEYIGHPTWIDDSAINICDHFRDPTNNRTAFTFKRFNNTDWEYFGSGFYNNGSASMIGGQKINGIAYAILSGYVSADSTALVVYSFTPGINVWTKVVEQHIPWTESNFNAHSGTFLGNGNTPTIVFYADNRVLAYQVDVASNTISLKVAANNVEGAGSWAVLNGDIYVSHTTSNLVTVSKLLNNGLQTIGSPGMYKNTSSIQLVVANNKLYCINYKRMVLHEDIYIATPE